jgi:FtsP/CotA-like multicopper oxidase with cupredoxin domain
MTSQNLSRRDFLRIAGMGSAALMVGNRFGFLHPHSSTSTQMEPFVPDAEISLTAKEKWVQILSGSQTRVWSYEGQLLSGSGVTMQAIPGSHLGPIIRAKTGTKLRIYFHNELSATRSKRRHNNLFIYNRISGIM